LRGLCPSRRTRDRSLARRSPLFHVGVEGEGDREFLDDLAALAGLALLGVSRARTRRRPGPIPKAGRPRSPRPARRSSSPLPLGALALCLPWRPAHRFSFAPRQTRARTRQVRWTSGPCARRGCLLLHLLGSCSQALCPRGEDEGGRGARAQLRGRPRRSRTWTFAIPPLVDTGLWPLMTTRLVRLTWPWCGNPDTAAPGPAQDAQKAPTLTVVPRRREALRHPLDEMLGWRDEDPATARRRKKISNCDPASTQKSSHDQGEGDPRDQPRTATMNRSHRGDSSPAIMDDRPGKLVDVVHRGRRGGQSVGARPWAHSLMSF